jgi:hypothetical protein
MLGKKTIRRTEKELSNPASDGSYSCSSKIAYP